MVLSAGVASLPPAQDIRVLIGAAVISAAWALVVVLIHETGSRLVTSALVLLDVFYAAIFYVLSRPSARDASGEVYQRNWAAYVFAVFVPLIFLELANLLVRSDGWFRAPAFGLLGGAALVILYGFARGFGVKPALIFSACVALIAAAATISYVRTLNFLTLMIIAIITVAALRSARANLRRWFGRSDARRDRRDGDDALRDAPVGARAARRRRRP
jgi:hypothetical protein